MDVKALGEELERLLDEKITRGEGFRLCRVGGASETDLIEIRTLSQAIIALEAVQRMTKPYVSPYAGQPEKNLPCGDS